MNIISNDSKCCIPLGGSDTWNMLCSTVMYHLSAVKKQLSNAFSFLENGQIEYSSCLNAAREFNLIRDALSQISPDQIVYDAGNPQIQPPWGNNISPVITSCANYLTTGNGDDLLAEIVKLLTYAAYAKTNVHIE